MATSAQQMLEELRQTQSPAQQMLEKLRSEGAAKAEVQDSVVESMPEIPTNWDEIPTNLEWNPSSDIAAYAIGTAKSAAKGVGGATELAMTIASGGFGEIVAGAWNAGAMLAGRSNEDAVKSIRAISEAMTFQPRTDAGKAALDAIAKPLVALEEGATEISWRLSMGNPYAAMAIKTALVGGVEFIIPGKATIKRASLKVTVYRQSRKVAKMAKELGLDLHVENLAKGRAGMGASIVDLARRMTPDERAANASLLQEAMRAAETKAKKAKALAYETAKETKTFIKTRAVSDFAADLRLRLVNDAYDVAFMPDLNKTLTELSGMAGDATNLKNLEMIRKRSIRRRTDAYASGRNSEGSALHRTIKGIDEFLDNEFNSIAIEQGQNFIPRGGNLFGETKGVAAWKAAREANTSWMKRFHDDKIISQLIDKEATPEMMRQWLMGASVMNASKQASSVIGRMKKVLGENHPAIEGIRLDFLYEVMEPLLKLEPNYKQFATNYDAMVRRNPSLVKALNLDGKDLAFLEAAARTQAKLPPAEAMFRITDVTKAMAQLFAGHGLAKAQLRVNLLRGIANRVIGVDKIPSKQILAELTGAIHGAPMIPKNSPLAAEFIAGAALTGITDEKD